MAKQDAIKAAGLETTLYELIDAGFSYSEICEKFMSDYGVKTYPASIARLKFERDQNLKKERQAKKQKTVKPPQKKARTGNDDEPPIIEPIVQADDDKTVSERLANSYEIAAKMLEKGMIEAAANISPLPLKQAAIVEKIASILAKHTDLEIIRARKDLAGIDRNIKIEIIDKRERDGID